MIIVIDIKSPIYYHTHQKLPHFLQWLLDGAKQRLNVQSCKTEKLPNKQKDLLSDASEIKVKALLSSRIMYCT